MKLSAFLSLYHLSLFLIAHFVLEGDARIRRKRDFRVGQKRCQPRFSEISTLYLGTDAQRNNNEYDEFLEIEFPREHCGTVKRPSLMPYVIIAVDTKPKYVAAKGSLLYASLHQRTLKPDTLIFVMDNQTDRSKAATAEFDVEYRRDLANGMISGIDRNALRGSFFSNLSPSNEEVSNFPVIFMLLETPRHSHDRGKLKRLLRIFQFVRVEGRVVRPAEAGAVRPLAIPSMWTVAFDNAVDVVVVNRNSHTTKLNRFTKEMFNAFPVRRIVPSMVSVTVHENTLDPPRGRSIPFCNPDVEDGEYTSTHVSMYWKMSMHTPGRENDCRAAEFLRKFDEITTT
ncbi:hypothetical protein Y032_1353g3844 [Ancylostoma ceylanicum]|uniref:Uncharacterized protein n=1 Tax=Ancylostoma ceylanicum TaxID=53326 RepID=A0A016W6B7_9BILA|nr:hypothetical protein Y032_1353g3844 [Ancylostoma ceylanicum]